MHAFVTGLGVFFGGQKNVFESCQHLVSAGVGQRLARKLVRPGRGHNLVSERLGGNESEGKGPGPSQLDYNQKQLSAPEPAMSATCATEKRSESIAAPRRERAHCRRHQTVSLA